MGESSELLALRKQLLLARCRLCRLQIDAGSAALCGRLSWRQPPPPLAPLLRFLRRAGFLALFVNLLFEVKWTKKSNR